MSTQYKFPDDYLSIFEFSYYAGANYFYSYTQYRTGKFRGGRFDEAVNYGFRSKHFILIDELKKYGWDDENIKKLKEERVKKIKERLNRKGFTSVRL